MFCTDLLARFGISLCSLCCFPLCFCISFLIRLHAPAVVSVAMMQCLQMSFSPFFVALPQVFVYPSKSTDNCYPRTVCLQSEEAACVLIVTVFNANAQNAWKQDILLQQEEIHPQAGKHLLSPSRNSLAWDSSFVSIGLTGSCNWIELIIDR